VISLTRAKTATALGAVGKVTDFDNAPFVVEGDGPHALKIYFENEASKLEYLCSPLHHPYDPLSCAYTRPGDIGRGLGRSTDSWPAAGSIAGQSPRKTTPLLVANSLNEAQADPDQEEKQ
jgi:hypothetical protein